MTNDEDWDRIVAQDKIDFAESDKALEEAGALYRLRPLRAPQGRIFDMKVRKVLDEINAACERATSQSIMPTYRNCQDEDEHARQE